MNYAFKNFCKDNLRYNSRTTSFQTCQSCSNRWSSSVRLKHFKTVSGRTVCSPGCCQQRFCLECLDTFSVSRHHVVLALSEKHCAVYASESRQRRSSQRKPSCRWMHLVMHVKRRADLTENGHPWVCVFREVYNKPNYINQSASSTFHSPKNF